MVRMTTTLVVMAAGIASDTAATGRSPWTCWRPTAWLGATDKEDRPKVQQALLELHAKGVCPEKL